MNTTASTPPSILTPFLKILTTLNTNAAKNTIDIKTTALFTNKSYIIT